MRQLESQLGKERSKLEGMMVSGKDSARANIEAASGGGRVHPMSIHIGEKGLIGRLN